MKDENNSKLSKSGMKSGSSKIDVPTIVIMIMSLAVVLPLLLPWMFVFKTRLEFAYHPWALPESLHFENFVQAWKTVQIGRGLVNTLIICAGAILVTVPAATMGGYIFARYKSKWTEVVFYLVMVGYFVPVQMVLIPLFRMGIKVGFHDTLWGLFLPIGTLAIPFWTMIFRSFFAQLPPDLADAGRIDGAGHVGIFYHIMFPLAQPATFLALILVFMGAWSDYILGLVMINSQKLFPMQLRVSQFLNAYGTEHMPRYAAAVIISAAPTVILYTFTNKWIIRGTLAGAIKG